MTGLRRRERGWFQIGVIASLFLLCAAKPVRGQAAEHGDNQRCLNCHGQEHITTISPEERETMVVVPESGMPERKKPAALFVDQSLLARGFHGGVACSQCHPGTETLPHSARLSEPHCESCHQEEVEEVSRSRHAKVIRTVDPRPPRCWDCHGGHEFRPLSKVSPLEKIRVCASCHQKYSGRMAGLENGGVLVRSYLDSVHGQTKPGTDKVGATCEDCHGNHEILPVKDPRSKVHRLNIPDTCGQCHPEIRKEFESTVHAEIARRHDLAARAALCSDCHTAHAITHTNTPAFVQDIVSECGICHQDLYRTYRQTYHGQVLQLGSTRVAKCSDCHGAHNIRRPNDPQSLLSASNRAVTCSRCHKEISRLPASARENFVAYHPHADFRDGKGQLSLFLIWRVTLILGTVLLVVWAVHFLVWANRNLRNKDPQTEPASEHAILRFKPLQCRLHILAAVSVMGLTLTGLPLKFSRQSWIGAALALLGGPDTAGFIHRVFAVILIGIALFHVFAALFPGNKANRPIRKRFLGSDSLLPVKGDWRRFTEMIRWFRNRGPRPELDRWSYREKFDYWALAITLGGIAISGLFLWYPTFFARFLSGYWFNVAMVTHSYAGLMAVGFFLLIHILNTSLRRKGFPVNDVMLTGRLSEKEFQEERPAHYARLSQSRVLDQLRVQPVSAREAKIAFYAALASQILGIGIFILIICAIIL
jgi:cytochrome b subunit of formate dehydrogenase